MKVNHNITATKRRTIRVRSKVHGTAERPRLTVNRSNKFTYLQVIDDTVGKTLAAARSEATKEVTKLEEAKTAATTLAKKLSAAKITKLVFDRGGYKYHGRVQAIADVMRESGIQV